MKSNKSKLQSNNKLSWIGVSAVYIGVIMGAGFASGRECWQFFGVFGKQGFYGTLYVTIAFFIISFMLTFISLKKNTNDLGELISPIDNSFIKRIIKIILAITYYSMIIAMTAAGGSLLNQQFGINKAVGGAIIGVAVLITILGDFERISMIFKYIEPVMITIALITIISIIFNKDISQSGNISGFEISKMTPNWIISSMLFVSFNSLGMITIASDAALNAKDKKNAFCGAGISSILLGLLTIILLFALQKDMTFSDSLDMPMLGFSMKINKILNILYAIVLCLGVYSTGSGTYYAFGKSIPESKLKKPILIFGILAGYVVGLTGFKKIVLYLYPIQGYLGIAILIFIFLNFCKEFKNN